MAVVTPPVHVQHDQAVHAVGQRQQRRPLLARLDAGLPTAPSDISRVPTGQPGDQPLPYRRHRRGRLQVMPVAAQPQIAVLDRWPGRPKRPNSARRRASHSGSCLSASSRAAVIKLNAISLGVGRVRWPWHRATARRTGRRPCWVPPDWWC